MKRFKEKLKWLIENQEKIEELLNNKEKEIKKDKNFSVSGVPEFQMDYVNKVLSEKDVFEMNQEMNESEV